MSEEKKQEPPTFGVIDLGAELKRYEAKDPAPQREERVADPTASAGDAPMYVPPNSVPVLQSLIAEAAALGHWALREQLRGILASVEVERDQLRRVERERDELQEEMDRLHRRVGDLMPADESEGE